MRNWRLRGAVLAAYAINGFCLSAWNVRLPTIGDQVGLDEAGLGRFLMAGAIGTLLTIPLAGRWVTRCGAPRIYLVATAGLVTAYLLMAAALAAGSELALFGAGVVHGIAFATTNVPQSVLGTIAEARTGRTILSQFHAAFSIAAAAGAAAGGAASTAGVSPATELLILAVVALAGRTCVWLLLHPPEHSAAPATAAGSRVWLVPQVLLLGTVVFGASLSEGAANNWVSPTLVDGFSVTEGTAATAVSVFLLAQTAARLLGGRFVDATSPHVALITSGLVAAAGIAAFTGAPVLWMCWAGVALWGIGAALPLPVAVSLAAREADGPERIAAVTSLSSLANLAGPPLIGAAAGVVGLRWALASIVVVLLAGILAARASRTAG